MQDLNIVFGAPGCGKTTYLLNVLEKLLKKYEPNEIAFVSFTRKGSYEGRDRAIEKFGYGPSDFPFFRTLHSIAFRDGGFTRNDVISKHDYKVFSHAMGMSFTGYYTEDFRHNDDTYLFLEYLERENPIRARQYYDWVDIRKFKSVKHQYKKFKEYAQVIDFTDMIEEFVKKDVPLPVKVAIIDEAQDLTKLQWRFCETAFRNCEAVYVAGDDDQGIYEWSGADVNYFIEMGGRVKILEQSYRLRPRVLSFAKRISGLIQHRVKKDFDPFSTDDQGQVFLHNHLSDVPFDSEGSYYLLSRNNCFLDRFEERLKMEGLVYTRKGRPSVIQREVDAINLFEKVRRSKNMDDTSEGKLSEFLVRPYKLELPWFHNLNIPADRAMYYRDLIKSKTELYDDRISVNTVHGVKGGEADNVVLLLDVTRSVNKSIMSYSDAEMRCLYVGCTRARHRLDIVLTEGSLYGFDAYVNFIDLLKESESADL